MHITTPKNAGSGPEIETHWLVHPADPNSPISIRAIPPTGSLVGLSPKNFTFHPKNFESEGDRKAAFEKKALELSDRGYNVYTPMNRIRADFTGDVGVKDADISHRTHILIDIDRKAGKENPANGLEMSAAFDLAAAITEGLNLFGISNLWRVHSGNGVHLYIPIDPTPTSNNETRIVQDLLRTVDQNFQSQFVSVDRSVSNPGRITKVIGTLARKGVASEDRPFRIARIV